MLLGVRRCNWQPHKGLSAASPPFKTARHWEEGNDEVIGQMADVVVSVGAPHRHQRTAGDHLTRAEVYMRRLHTTRITASTPALAQLFCARVHGQQNAVRKGTTTPLRGLLSAQSAG